MYMLYKKILLIIQNIKVMSENKFEYIDDVILNVDKDKVEKNCFIVGSIYEKREKH